MKKKHCIVLLLLVLAVCTGNGQSIQEENNRNVIGISLGWELGAYRDHCYGNLNQEICAPSLSLFGVLYTGDFMHHFSLSYYVADPKSVLSEQAVLLQDYDPIKGEPFYTVHQYPVKVHRAHFEYGLSALCWSVERFGGFAGASIRGDMYLQFAHYPLITAAFSLMPSYTQYWQPDAENRVSMTTAIPLLGWALRPPYAGADALMMKYAEDSPMKILTMGGLTSLHNNRALHSSLVYEHALNEHCTLVMGSDLSLSHFIQPRPRKDLEWSVHSGAAFSF